MRHSRIVRHSTELTTVEANRGSLGQWFRGMKTEKTAANPTLFFRALPWCSLGRIPSGSRVGSTLLSFDEMPSATIGYRRTRED